MTDVIGPYRASLRLGRRRSLIVLLGIALALLGVLAWSSYSTLGSERKFLHQLQSGKLSQESLYRFGVACSGEDFGNPSPGESVKPQNLPECQFVAPGGKPIGPTFKGDPFGGPGGVSITQADLAQMLPTLIEGQKQVVLENQRILAPRNLFASRARMLGTFVGIVFAVLLGATWFGAEFRWGIWKTLLSHEPRRGRVLLGKLLGLWTLVLVGFLAALAVISVVDVVMRVVLDVHASGGPTVARMVSQSGWALLSLEMYATIAAAFAVAARVSLAGLITLLMIVGDGLLVSKYHWLRHYFPTQQIATLLPRPNLISTGYIWHDPIIGGLTCSAPPTPILPGPDISFGSCRAIILKPIPHWRASAVLVAWLIAFVFIAWGILRARDVPQ